MRRPGRLRELAESYDLVVIGAGPAGLAAAATGAACGLSVLLADENPSPGGQIYRGITSRRIDPTILGEAYGAGRHLVDACEASDAAVLPGATIWALGPLAPAAGGGIEIALSQGGESRSIRSATVIAATGALERPFPVPGWTLPGVMTAGAAQIALKTAGLVPDGRVVAAGTGPLLYLLVAQLRAAGAGIAALVDTTPRENLVRALPHVPDFLRSPYLGKGWRLLRQAMRGLRLIRGVTTLAAEGASRVEQVVIGRGGREERVGCDLLLLHQGVVPNTNLSNAVGCRHRWDPGQLAWLPVVDAWFESSVPGLAIAGDGAGIGGAESAAFRGQLAALGAVSRLGRLDPAERERRSGPIRVALARAERGRRFLEELYRPADAFRIPADPDTIVCRCEEVRAGAVREAVGLGALGPNQLKAFLRCGMGPCQGRLCALTVTEIMAAERGVSPAEIGAYRLRPPFKPVTLGELASLPTTPEAIAAIER